MTLNPLVKAMALKNIKDFREMFRAHDEECESYSRQGYRPHYCVHGVNQWTDYDNICGYCEDGYGWWDYQTFAELAIENAKRDFDYAHQIFEEVTTFSNMADDKKLSFEAREALENMAADLAKKGSEYLDNKLPAKK